VPEPGGFAAPGFNPSAIEPGNDPSQWPAITLLPPAQAGGQAVPGQAGLQPGNPQFNPQLQFPGQFQPGQQQAGQQFPGQQFPGQPFPGQPFTPGQPPQGQQPIDQQLGQFGQPFPGQAQQNGTLGAFPPGLPGQLPGQPGFNPQLANQNNLGQNNPGQNNPVQSPVRSGPDGQFIPVTNLPGQVVNTQTGGVQPTPTQPQFPQGLGTPTGGQGSAPNTALDLINKLLTTPSQNVPAGVGNNNTVAGGIAGVASTYQGPSIKVYRERQKYNEWEFVFDLKSNQPGANQQQNGQQGGNQQQNGQQNQNQQNGSSSIFTPQNQNQGFSLGSSPGAPSPR
jgi:PAX-interacting protein 1